MKTIIKAVFALLFACFHIAHAQSQQVKIIIPFSPGGGVDHSFQHLKKFADDKGLSLIPVYKPGADGLLALNDYRQNLDPYTAMIATTALLALDRAKNNKDDFLPVTLLRKSSMAVVVRRNSEIQNFDQLEKLLQIKQLNLGYAAPGQKFVFSQLTKRIKTTDQIWIPYKGTGSMLTDLAGGHIDIAVCPIGAAKSLIDQNKIRLVALTEPIHGIDTVILNKKYKDWLTPDGFVFVVNPNIDKNILAKYQQLLFEYLNSDLVKKTTIEDLYIPTPFSSELVEKYIKYSEQMF